MVNQTNTKKETILKLLYKASGDTVSGVRISEATGISRVAVWKHISALKQSGVPIESRPNGYVLSRPEDLLFPFCFEKPFRERIHHFQEVNTTMDTAKALAREGAPHLSCVIAEHQTKGRGRLNREWVSAEGGLWFTLILRPPEPPHLVYIYNFAASLCLSKVLKQLFDLKVSVKWPNDLLLGGKKLAGMLSEMETRGDMVQFLVVGIGINVNNDPAHKEFNAVSLKNVLKKKVSRKHIMTQFLSEFQNRIQDINCPDIIDQWKKQTSTIGSRVRVETFDRIHEGKAVDVDETGALIIEDDRQQQQKIIYGDCFHA
ncbi:MAG: biotin--[acetyl-CoA-carboxylase] ligase [Proteobacteria bacterium]|nr:biotin--[acetyl-CoA-carboxylase] ligase [Desulfobacula sp.]MBU3954544.1 biotin--[acetyl-CoA-carboxylase] ligase [Pseudomonadota bacterium]MBU4133113.1 biotin--[acetyl-CoA-carboxylase] ligase [Pseudomonadota bacterium]